MFRIDLADGDAQLIVRGERLNSLFGPAWSRDGKTLFYARDVPGWRSFVARELATGNEREVARGKLLTSARPVAIGMELGGFKVWA